MTRIPHAQRERIDGLAVFAAVGFALALGVIYALERVGAPDGFVAALGPLAALLALCVIGVSARAPRLPDFLAARRMLPALYGGLALAATASGGAAAIAAAPGGFGDPPWRGFAAGLVVAALVVAPRWRGENASAVGDVLATHYPSAPARAAFTVLLAGIGALTAIAGFELATQMLTASFGASPRLARALSMLALAASIVPGGLKGVLWSDAASAGGAALIGAIGAGLAATETPAPLEALRSNWRAALAPPLGGADNIGMAIAGAVAITFFFALAAPAFGSGSRAEARRAGFAGLAWLALGFALATVALPFLGHAAETSRAAAALTGAAAWMPALALARAGVYGVARARGLDLATAHSRLNVLSSTRIASIRASALIAIGLCPVASAALGLDAASALYLALALGLAFATPSLLLALALPVSTVSALAALGVAAVVASARAFEAGRLPRGPDLLLDALIVAVAGLVVGAAATVLFPGSRKRPANPRADPFIDAPIDPSG